MEQMIVTTKNSTNSGQRKLLAAIRAVIRLCSTSQPAKLRYSLNTLVTSLLLLCLMPFGASPAMAQAASTGTSVAAQSIAATVTFKDTRPDLSLKVWGGNIVVQRGYMEGNWHPNLDWLPIKFTYDNLDSSIKTITRGSTEYSRIAAGVFQDQVRNILRQTPTGFRWNDRKNDWIEYNPAGEIKALGNRNGTVATFKYSGAAGAVSSTGVPVSEGRIAGILDHSSTQVLWFEYDASNRISSIRDIANRKVSYQWIPGPTGMSMSVIDVNGNTWNYAMGTGLAITDPENHTTTRTWFPSGALSSITYPDGSATTYAQDYDNAKNIFYSRETAPGGKVTETWSELKQDLNRGEYLRRDINGVTVSKQSVDTGTRTTTTTDARGLDTAVTKDQWDNITKTVYPDGSSVSTQYDATYSNVTRHTDENGVITQYSYDAKGNLTKMVEALGLAEQRTTEYTNNADGQRTSMTRKGDANTADVTTKYEYDSNGNVITLTDAEGGITRYTYDVMGNAITKTDPRGKLWKQTYDNNGKLLTTTDPISRTTRVSYDKSDLPVSRTDAANNTSTLEYDPTGKLLTNIDAYGSKTGYTFDTAGNPVTRTNAENHIHRQYFDSDGRLIKRTDGNNNVTQFVYGDSASGLNGLLNKIIYPTLSQDLQYDQRDRIIQTTDSSAGLAQPLDGSPNQTTINQYDSAGNLISMTDSAIRTTGIRYDALGQVSQTIDPANGTTQYVYDPRGNLLTVTDAKGSSHRFEYDNLDRMVKEIRPLGQTLIYAYDANNNLIQITDPKGQIKQYVYDDVNRRTQENFYLNAAALTSRNSIKSISYAYNILDKLTSYTDGNTIATYSYDTRQLRQIGLSVNYGNFSLATSTSYNSLGQKSSLIYPDGAQYSYTYDANNQLSTVNFPSGFGSITFNSYIWTVPSQITLPGGSVRNQSYDGLLRLKDFSVKDPGQSSVMSYQYSYDNTNNITSKTTEKGKTDYSYDTLDHLTAATYSGTGQANESYTYDSVDNRLTDSKTAAATWVYDANNQLTSAGTISYTYDANGNTTNQTDSANPVNTRNYIYDTDNRLIEVRNSSNTLIAAYSYDPFGRRLSKDAGTSKTYYFYNEEGLIAEADATGQLTKSYGYAPGSTFTTNPLWQKSGNAYYTYQNDHLGMPMKLLSQSGAVVWSATYDAFGNATVDAGSSISNNLRFPGQYFDQETGLHYNWNRFYDPQTGRYISSDPIGLKGGINEYVYVKGNTLRWFDSNGLDMFCLPGMKCWSDKIPPTDNIPPTDKKRKKVDNKCAERQPTFVTCMACCQAAAQSCPGDTGNPCRLDCMAAPFPDNPYGPEGI
jgi:large repetitive protein